MGIGGYIDRAADGLEGAVGSAKKAVGGAVEWGSDKVADGLDHVGLDGTAENVRDGGESLANRLGAEVDERNLGESDDPKELLHGSPDKIESTARHLRDFFSAFENVGQGLRGLDSGDWQGRAADAFREKFDVQPKAWLTAADACESAAKALETYADTVRWAQNQAREAIEKWRAAERASKQAVESYNARVDAYNSDVDTYNSTVEQGGTPGAEPVKPGPFSDPGKEGRAAAEHLLAEARRQRNDAGQDAQRRLAAALETAPRKPGFTDRLKANGEDLIAANLFSATHMAGGVVKSLTDVAKLARTFNPVDPYNLTHPAQVAAQQQMVLAGLTNLAAHPEQLPKSIIGSGWKSDPSEATGVLLGNLIGTKGAGGAARAGLRGGLKAGAEGAARKGLFGRTAEMARRLFGRKCLRDPVDVATGRMLLPQTDITLPALLPLTFERFFESSWRAGRWFGPTWTSTADQRLEVDAEGVIFVSADGTMLSYPHPVPGLPVLPAEGARQPLEINLQGEYTLTDPESGRVWHFDAPADGPDGIAPLAQISDRTGQWITFAYDEEGAPTSIAHSAGYHLKVTTLDGRITALHLAGAAEDGGDTEIVRFGYDEAGHLADVTNSSGIPTRFGNDAVGRITSWTDTNGSSFHYVYDDRDRCVAQGGVEGHMASTFTYGDRDPETGLGTTAMTDSQGRISRYLVDDRCQVVAETDPTGATTRTAYDRFGKVRSITDPLGRTTQYVYDEVGRLSLVIRPDGHYTSAAHNRLGLPTTVTSPDGAVWRRTYDERGNPTAGTDPTGATTRYTYTASGHLASITDALGATTTVTTNRAGLPLSVTDPLGATTVYEHDAFGRTTSVTNALGHRTSMVWTVEGKLALRRSPDGAVESWTYDGEGNCTRHMDALGHVTTFEYTHFDLLTSRTDPDGTRHVFTHDTDLRLTQVTNPQGLVWSYEYDAAGRLVTETDFDDRRVTYEHDPAGRLTTRTTPLGDTIGFTYDPLGNLTTKDVAGALTHYTYDVAGRPIRIDGPDATLTYTYDAAGRTLSESTDGRTVSYAYDVLGRRTSRTTPTGAVSEWSYDAAGNRASLTASGRTLAFTHDALGQELTRTLGDRLTLTSTWDPLGRLTTHDVTGPHAELLQHRAYTYRADGNLTAIDDALNGPRRFTLDTAGRVTTVDARNWSETYAYDSAGNQTLADWPDRMPGGQDATGERAYTGTRITRAGNIRYEHDAAGRTTLRQKTRLSRKPDTWRYTWDAEDRLTTCTTPDGERWRYRYDPLGRRVAKQRLSSDGESILEQVDFTWDGTTLCEQSTHTPGAATPAVTLTWDHDGQRPLAQRENKSLSTAPQREIDERFFAIVTDLVGTPTELVDEQGDIAWRTRTTLWGTTTWPRTSTCYTPLRFPGQYFDPETGLHYNYFRHYEPESGRYLTPDPLGLAPGPSPTAYVVNPHRLVDPLGLTPCEIEGPQSARQLRNTPGAATGGGSLPDVNGQWLRGSEGNAGRIPGQVARELQGMDFKNFDHFREAFWKKISQHDELASQFDKSGQTAMSQGKAPYAPTSQHHGQGRYVLHHVLPIQHGGGVYDLDNLVVVSPRYHKEILDGRYHFGGG
ncbi:putative T7SS-secreted protein [Streptomyces sp. NPDC006422]|uniref:putative T7SS-secreted protein n=1 Tax=unclassified Streptomyces TaxID=2593676 RepID=UPI0033A40406